MFIQQCRRHWAILLVFIVALSGRLVIAAIHAQNFPTYHDEGAYLEIAESIRHNFSYTRSDGSEELTRGPLYSGFLAILSNIFGFNPVAISIAQCFIGAALWALVFHVSQHLLRSANVARTAEVAGCCTIAVASVMPVTLFRDPLILSEGIAGVLLTGMVLLRFQSQRTERREYRRAGIILAGIACGLLVLAKPAFLPFLVVFPIFQIFCDRMQCRSISVNGALLFVLSGIVIIAPWTVRNYSVAGGFIPVGIAGGPYLWIGTHADGELSPHALSLAIASVNDGKFTASSRLSSDTKYKKLAVARILDNPFNYFAICLTRLPKTWLTSHFDPLRRELGLIPDWIRGVFYGLNAGVVVLAFIGGGIAFCRRDMLPMMAFVTWVYSAGVHCLIFSGSRYTVPVWPLIAVCAAYGTAKSLHYILTTYTPATSHQINAQCNSI